MVRISKSSVTAASPVPAPVAAAPEVVVAPVEEKKAKKEKAAPKAKKEKASEPVVEVAPVPEPVVEEPAAVVEEAADELVIDKTNLSSVLLSEIAEFNKNFKAWTSIEKAINANVKNITKISSRISKVADKSTKKRKNTKNKPSGFEKPTLISDALAVFFERPIGSRMPRTEVSKKIHEYIVTHNLQNAANRRNIHPDMKLKQLLSVNDDELTYFNLQKFLKHHFKKDAPTASA